MRQPIPIGSRRLELCPARIFKDLAGKSRSFERATRRSIGREFRFASVTIVGSPATYQKSTANLSAHLLLARATGGTHEQSEVGWGGELYCFVRRDTLA